MTVYTFINAPPNGGNTLVPTGFNQNDILRSPSGTYNGVLGANGDFTVSFGPDKNTGPVSWTAQKTVSGGPPYSIGYLLKALPPDFTLVSPNYSVSNSNGSSEYSLIGVSPGPKNNFLQLNDNGTLSLYPGKSGVATGAALKTIGSSENLQYLTLTNVQYGLADAKIPKVGTVFGTTQQLTNSLPSGSANLTAHLSLTYADTQSYDWNTSNTVTKEINSTTTIKVPAIGSTAVSLTLNKSTTIAEGKSTASGMETTYQSEVTIAVPAGATYAVDIYATQQDALVPFTYTGIYNFPDGLSIPGSGSGVLDGVSLGIFDAHATCIAPASFCSTPASRIPDQPALPKQVPEPSSLTTLLPALLSFGTIIAVRKRRARSKRPRRVISTAPSSVAPCC